MNTKMYMTASQIIKQIILGNKLYVQYRITSVVAVETIIITRGGGKTNCDTSEHVCRSCINTLCM